MQRDHRTASMWTHLHVRLSDEQWERIRHHFPKESRPKGRWGRPPAPARRVFEAVLWILHTGAQWNFLPQCYPNYKTVHRRFQAWVRTGVLDRVLEDLVGEANQLDLFDESEAYDSDSDGNGEKASLRTIQ